MSAEEVVAAPGVVRRPLRAARLILLAVSVAAATSACSSDLAATSAEIPVESVVTSTAAPALPDRAAPTSTVDADESTGSPAAVSTTVGPETTVDSATTVAEAPTPAPDAMPSSSPDATVDSSPAVPATTVAATTAPGAAPPSSDRPVAASPPTTGDVTEVVQAAPQSTLVSVPLVAPANVEGDVRVEVASVKRVKGEARLPGEVAGPALAVRVRVTNTSRSAIDLAAVTVNLRDERADVAVPLTASPAAPLDGELRPGQDAEGTYLFEYADSRSETITIEVSSAPDAPTAVFVGTIS